MGKERMIVYTKKDLAFDKTKGGRHEQRIESLLRGFNQPAVSMFANLSKHDPRSVVHSTSQILEALRQKATDKDSLMTYKVMVIGMPNIGKSTLLNAFRNHGVGKAKVAKTGAQPGVTRNIGSTVRILEAVEGSSAAVHVLDTPGVFIPYVPNAEAMLKLSLCGSVKDTIISPIILADYLLYQLNLRAPSLYADFSNPTNHIDNLLSGVAKRTGRLQKGGSPDLDASALWFIQRWREGHVGHFMLDNVNEDTLNSLQSSASIIGTSISQGRKAEKYQRRERFRAT